MVTCTVEKSVRGSNNRAHFSQRAFQKRVKHVQVETGKSSTCTEKAISRERKIINTDVAAGIASVNRARTGRLIGKLQEDLKGVESFHHLFFIFWILN